MPEAIRNKQAIKPEFGVVVVRRMTQLGVAVIPQNFEIFYAAMSGCYQDLAQELHQLGNAPKQNEIDRVACRYLAERLQNRVAGITHQKLNQIVETLQTLIENETDDLTKFSGVMSKASREFETAVRRGGTPAGNPLLSVIRAVMESTSNRSDETQNLASKIHHEAGELDKTRKELETFRALASTDYVTQLLNRRSFDEQLQKIYISGNPATTGIILLDIDHFKTFNDTHGHAFGDVILKRVAETIKANIKSNVLAARVGGEEFALITNDLDIVVVELLAEKIRSAVENLENVDRKSGKDFGQITISIGICMAYEADNAQMLYRYADEMLYRSKGNGRNCTSIYSKNIPKSEMLNLDYNGRYFRQSDPDL